MVIYVIVVALDIFYTLVVKAKIVVIISSISTKDILAITIIVDLYIVKSIYDFSYKMTAMVVSIQMATAKSQE